MDDREEEMMNDGTINKAIDLLEYGFEDEVNSDVDWIINEEGEIVRGFEKDLTNTKWTTHFFLRAIPYMVIDLLFQWFNIA